MYILQIKTDTFCRDRREENPQFVESQFVQFWFHYLFLKLRNKLYFQSIILHENHKPIIIFNEKNISFWSTRLVKVGQRNRHWNFIHMRWNLLYKVHDDSLFVYWSIVYLCDNLRRKFVISKVTSRLVIRIA